jgi:hypothetical protein
MKSEVQYLRTQSKKWGNNLSTRRINKEDAWYTLNCTIMKTIEYPWPTNTEKTLPGTTPTTPHLISPFNLKAGLCIWCGPEKLHTPNKETLYD